MLGLFLLLAVKKPSEHRSLITSAGLWSIGHAIVMAIQTMEAWNHGARRMGVEVTPDPMPEKVLFIRSDQYSFARRGVPAIFFFQFKSADPNLNGGA